MAATATASAPATALTTAAARTTTAAARTTAAAARATTPGAVAAPAVRAAFVGATAWRVVPPPGHRCLSSRRLAAGGPAHVRPAVAAAAAARRSPLCVAAAATMGSSATADADAGLAANPAATDPTGRGGGPLPPTPSAAILKYVTAEAAAAAVVGGGGGPAPACIVVGTHAALCSGGGGGDGGGSLSPPVAAALPAAAADVAAAWLASPAASGDSGGVLSFPVLGAAGQLVPVALVVLPARTSRHNCPAAPHVAAERLRGLLAEAAGGGRGGSSGDAAAPLAAGAGGPASNGNGDSDEAASSPRGAVVTILTTAAGVVPLGLAVARCLPLGGRKMGIGATGGTAATVRVALVSATIGDAAASDGGDDWADAAALLPHLAAGVRRAGWWTDAPPNEFTTDAFVAESAAAVDRLRAAGHGGGLTVEVKRAAALAKGGFGGLEGVGRAAADAGREPALVVLTYTPGPGATGARVALVGKGIVFDTGGLSIKSRVGMCGMRGDCGGAAAVLAAFEAAVAGGVVRGGGDDDPGAIASLSAVLCIAENAVGPRALRPDDIISMYSRRTVMINNTDAEGRLVLGDGVAYAARDLRATTVIDIATLTGAQGIATGKRHAAVMSSAAALEAAAIAAGRTTGDLTHAVPYCPEFFLKEFSTPAAAMLNSVRDRSNAQVRCWGRG